jgi:putative transposase
MKTSCYSEIQIMAFLKQAEASSPVPDLCCVHAMSSSTFINGVKNTEELTPI